MSVVHPLATTNSPEAYAIILGSDLLKRHRHLNTVTLDIRSRMYQRLSVAGKEHHHVFYETPENVRRTCHVVVTRNGPPKVL